MGIGDYIWPFERKFSQIPCAREASIAALLGGPCTGALALIYTNRSRIAYKTTVYAGSGILWVSFIICRYQYAQAKNMKEQFQEAYRSGKID